MKLWAKINSLLSLDGWVDRVDHPKNRKRLKETEGLEAGQRSGSLLVTGLMRHNNSLILRVQCDCGSLYVMRSDTFVIRRPQMCGRCQRRVKSVTHGHATSISKSKTYRVWQGMKQRCKRHPHYVSRGISVCERWLIFENFLEDMGEVPDGMQIDRISNSGNYQASNCRWVTVLDQMNNLTKNIWVTAFGETKTIAQWARDSRAATGYAGIRKRLKRGVVPEVAISTPSRMCCTLEP